MKDKWDSLATRMVDYVCIPVVRTHTCDTGGRGMDDASGDMAVIDMSSGEVTGWKYEDNG